MMGRCKSWTLDSGVDSWTGLWTEIWTENWTDAYLTLPVCHSQHLTVLKCPRPWLVATLKTCSMHVSILKIIHALPESIVGFGDMTEWPRVSNWLV